MANAGELRALAEMVYDGVWPVDTSARDLGLPDGPAITVWYAAFSGSLDAAQELHNAVLPGWVVDHLSNNSGTHHLWWASLRLPVVASDDGGKIIQRSFHASAFDQTKAARAWLLAIVHALIDFEEAKDNG